MLRFSLGFIYEPKPDGTTTIVAAVYDREVGCFAYVATHEAGNNEHLARLTKLILGEVRYHFRFFQTYEHWK